MQEKQERGPTGLEMGVFKTISCVGRGRGRLSTGTFTEAEKPETRLSGQ